MAAGLKCGGWRPHRYMHGLGSRAEDVGEGVSCCWNGIRMRWGLYFSKGFPSWSKSLQTFAEKILRKVLSLQKCMVKG